MMALICSAFSTAMDPHGSMRRRVRGGWRHRMQVAWARLVIGMLVGVGMSLASVLVAGAQPAPPELPDPARVTLDPATTAYLVLDVNSAVCPPRPACMAAIPAVSRL